jgi:hypothetical protein
MGHPSWGTEGYRILGFNLETGSPGRFTFVAAIPGLKCETWGTLRFIPTRLV